MRVSAAEKVNKQAEAVWNALDKIPSFTGKAKFMDRVLELKTHNHNLAWELGIDLSEAQR